VLLPNPRRRIRMPRIRILGREIELYI